MEETQESAIADLPVLESVKLVGTTTLLVAVEIVILSAKLGFEYVLYVLLYALIVYQYLVVLEIVEASTNVLELKITVSFLFVVE